MEYVLPSEEKPCGVQRDEGNPEANSSANDWIPLHIFVTPHDLSERHESAVAFPENGGIKCTERVQHFTPEAFVEAARVHA